MKGVCVVDLKFYDENVEFQYHVINEREEYVIQVKVSYDEGDLVDEEMRQV